MTQILDFDREVLVENFAKRSFPVHHHLVDHPLLTVESLAELADRLPATSVEHNLGNIPEVDPEGKVSSVDATPGEVARGIETNGSWMVLKRANDDPPYRQLLEESLNEVIPHVAHTEGGYTRQEAFIFLSAPNSVTPTHLDPEHNLLLQIRGSKAMTIGAYPDKNSEHRQIEEYFGGGHRNLKQLPADSTAYDMQPGDGVYVPLYAPHMVRNGPAVSISFSITFQTEASERACNIYSVNARLRKLGLSPKNPGEDGHFDSIKAESWGGLRKVRQAGKRVRAARSA